MRAIVRWSGIWFLAGSFMALIVDGVHWLANGALAPTPLGQFLYWLDPGALNLSQAFIERYTIPFLWDPVIVTVLTWPVWAVGGTLGLLLAWIGRRRARPALA